MTIDANGRDTFKDRYKPVTLNFSVLGTTGLWNLLSDDNSLGKVQTNFRNQKLQFLVAVTFPVTYIRVIWRGADPGLGRVDQLEVRAVKRQGNSLAVIQWWLSQQYAGVIGQNNEMIIPFVSEQPDRFPEEGFLGGYIESKSDTADPGSFLIDRVVLHGGPPPPTTATDILV